MIESFFGLLTRSFLLGTVVQYSTVSSMYSVLFIGGVAPSRRRPVRSPGSSLHARIHGSHACNRTCPRRSACIFPTVSLHCDTQSHLDASTSLVAEPDCCLTRLIGPTIFREVSHPVRCTQPLDTPVDYTPNKTHKLLGCRRPGETWQVPP